MERIYEKIFPRNCIYSEIFLGTVIVLGLIGGLSSFIIGFKYINSCNETVTSETVVDYTDCLQYKTDEKCSEIVNLNIPCNCYLEFNVTEDMEGEVIMYYELETYDQTNRSYATSRDDRQLSGDLSLTSLDHCGKYAYTDTPDGRKPIAPCGAIADSMFNDTFYLNDKTINLPILPSGMISESDKEGFKNPPGNLTEAFQKFSKPINWIKNIWELDPKNPDNNGFQNERFIGWMKTDWKRKPMWRLDPSHSYFKNGLPAFSYTLEVQYAYPTTLYSGARKAIAVSKKHIIDEERRRIGQTLVIVGTILMAISIAIACRIFWARKYERIKNIMGY